MHSMEQDELATYLNVLQRDECCRVDRVLKASDYEVTEVVSFPLENGAILGPFVRKRIRVDAHLGAAYRELYAAQRSGRRFRHLPVINDVHERDDELVVIMEYVRGRTLHDEVYERDPSLALACEWFPVLCDGVIELHEDFAMPLIHRDLKPSNVIVNGSSLTIIDFGIARAFREDAAADTAPFATRAYAPPEQFGYGQTDVRSDVYALGMVLYFLLTERNPTADLVKRGFNEPEIPPALRRVLLRACAFDPQGRYQSVRALKGAFAEAVTATVGGAAPLGGPRAVAPGQGMPGQPVPPSGRPQPAPWPGSVPQAAPVPAPGQPGYAPHVALGQSKYIPQPFPASPTPARPRFTYQELRQQGLPAGKALSGVMTSLSVGEILGTLWDVGIGLFWLLLALICLWCPFNPTEQMAQYPFAVRFVAYVPGVLLFFSGMLYAIMDKRIFRRFLPFMQKQTFGRAFLTALGLSGLGLAIMIIDFLCNMAAMGV